MVAVRKQARWWKLARESSVSFMRSIKLTLCGPSVFSRRLECARAHIGYKHQHEGDRVIIFHTISSPQLTWECAELLWTVIEHCEFRDLLIYSCTLITLFTERKKRPTQIMEAIRPIFALVWASAAVRWCPLIRRDEVTPSSALRFHPIIGLCGSTALSHYCTMLFIDFQPCSPSEQRRIFFIPISDS